MLYVFRIFGEADSSSLGLATDIVSSLDLNKDGLIQPAEFDKVNFSNNSWNQIKIK